MDCHICFDKKPKLRTLSCTHQLCSNCILRLEKQVCPFCRAKFDYTNDELKQRANIGLQNGYQSSYQPGLEIPDEFIFNSSREELLRIPNVISNRTIRFQNIFNIEDSLRTTRRKTKKNKCDINQINERRYNIAKREHKKWTRKNKRLEKMFPTNNF